MAWTVVETDAYGRLTEEQILGNAQMVWQYLHAKGWDAASVSAACGNFAHESYINPGQWQGGHYEDMSYGYGLGQWTPATKLRDFADARGLSWRGNGNTQCLMVDEDSGQWHASAMESGTVQSPPITFAQFKANQTKLSVDRLTELWYFYWEEPSYEYPGYASLPARKKWAQMVYELIGGTAPPEPAPTGGKLKWFYWCANIKRV